MSLRKLALTVGAFSVLAAPAMAQTCTGNPCHVDLTASATVNDVLRLTLSSTTTNLGSPTESDFDAGYKDAAGPSVAVKSNRPWHVDVAATASSFSYTAPAGSSLTRTKPASDLLWGTTAGTYGNNAGSSAQLASGNGTTGASAQAQIFFRTNWSYVNDVPGDYSLTVRFTAAAP